MAIRKRPVAGSRNLGTRASRTRGVTDAHVSRAPSQQPTDLVRVRRSLRQLVRMFPASRCGKIGTKRYTATRLWLRAVRECRPAASAFGVSLPITAELIARGPFGKVRRRLGIAAKYTRPLRAQTNGKGEHFI